MNNFRYYFKHPEWVRHQTDKAYIWVRGWIIKENQLYDAAALAQLLEEFTQALTVRAPLLQMSDFIRDWRGNFAFCVVLDDAVILGADIIRSIPLLYSQSAERVMVSDSYGWMQSTLDYPDLDVERAEEFLVSGVIFGPHSLHVGINGIQAGELVLLGRPQALNHRYFTFNPDIFQEQELSPSPEIYQSLDRVFQRVFQRMIMSAPDVNRWVVPLSGGYDSRLIVTYLSRLNIRNVLCFSYGRAGNIESEISKKVAEALGYEWSFAEYRESEWKELSLGSFMPEYFRQAFNGISLPHLPIIYIMQLHERGILKPGDIIVPGHTLDFLSGKQLKSNAVEHGISSNRFAGELLYRRHASYWEDEGGHKRIRLRIKSLLDSEDVNIRGRSAAAKMEWFNWQERQAKFIVNEVRGFDYLGYRWRLPLWDQDLTRWWIKIPFSHLLNRKLFRTAYETLLCHPKLRDIPFYSDAPPQKPDSLPHRIINALGELRIIMVHICPYFEIVNRVLEYYHPPRERETSLACEEFFANKASTIGQLLGISGSPRIKWPRNLRRHFRWRENWPVKQPSKMTNAISVAYIIMLYLIDSEKEIISKKPSKK